MTSATGSARAFLSYSRKDNETYDGVVDRLASELGGRFEAETGRSLDIFVDRESIPGGGDWRDKIAESIESATIFIPVVTMRYFGSAACREELLAFYDGADRLGVTDLILPVVLAGASQITDSDPRQEVRIIERLNYRRIDEAVDKGYQSPEWKAAVRTLVTDIARGLSVAEDAIAEREGVTPSIPPAAAAATSSLASSTISVPTLAPAGDVVGEDDGDLFSLKDDFDRLPIVGQAAMDSLTELSDVVTSSRERLDQLKEMSGAQQRATLLRLASDVGPVAVSIARTGADFETLVRSADRKFRSVLTQLDGAGGAFGTDLKQQILQPFQSMSAMSETLDGMGQVIEMLSAVGVMSVSLRKALEPAIRGVRSFRNALSIATSWETLAS